MAAAAPAAIAEDTYYPPVVTNPGTSAPTAQPAPPSVPVTPGSPYVMPAQAAPFAADASTSPTPYPAAERWVRRSQRLREASAQDAVPKPDPSALPPLPPLDLTPTTQTASQRDASFAPPTYAAPTIPDTMAQRPLSPAQMPGGTQFRSNVEGSPDYGAPPGPEKVKKPSQLPKVTQILPYGDYEPDPKVAQDNPCQNQCPMPNGQPCKTRDGRTLDCPQEITLSETPWTPRTYAPSLFAWQASNICYNPLYYQDVQLERYGHSYPFFVQPFVSMGRMTVQAIGFPYQAVIDPPSCNVYPLGYYRPGECAPKLIYQIPLNLEAALVEAGAITGTYFLFPHSAWAYAHPGQP
ncbi:MAG TPA: hypothetical protein VHX68_11545 [Planctomycetaceae bacterium]|nr:hypothetical protein [Planctomycetaceae bacterium]